MSHRHPPTRGGHPPADEGPSLQDRLIWFLEEATPRSNVKLGPDTGIFTTGLFDSLVLVQLVLWVEAEIGAPIDPSAFDLRKEWASVADIVAFIERHRLSASTRGTAEQVPDR